MHQGIYKNKEKSPGVKDQRIRSWKMTTPTNTLQLLWQIVVYLMYQLSRSGMCMDTLRNWCILHATREVQQNITLCIYIYFKYCVLLSKSRCSVH